MILTHDNIMLTPVNIILPYILTGVNIVYHLILDL